LNCECFLNLGNRLLSSNFFYHQIFFIKKVFYHSLFQNWLLLTQWLFKFKNLLLKPKAKIKFNEFLIWIPWKYWVVWYNFPQMTQKNNLKVRKIEISWLSNGFILHILFFEFFCFLVFLGKSIDQFPIFSPKHGWQKIKWPFNTYFLFPFFL